MVTNSLQARNSTGWTRVLLWCPAAHPRHGRRTTGAGTSSHEHFLAHVKWVPVLNAGFCRSNSRWELKSQTHAGPPGGRAAHGGDGVGRGRPSCSLCLTDTQSPLPDPELGAGGPSRTEPWRGAKVTRALRSSYHLGAGSCQLQILTGTLCRDTPRGQERGTGVSVGGQTGCKGALQRCPWHPQEGLCRHCSGVHRCPPRTVGTRSGALAYATSSLKHRGRPCLTWRSTILGGLTQQPQSTAPDGGKPRTSPGTRLAVPSPAPTSPPVFLPREVTGRAPADSPLRQITELLSRDDPSQLEHPKNCPSPPAASRGCAGTPAGGPAPPPPPPAPRASPGRRVSVR